MIRKPVAHDPQFGYACVRMTVRRSGANLHARVCRKEFSLAAAAAQIPISTGLGRSLTHLLPQMSCDHCEEIIGVYEPMIVKTGDEALRTSQAADPLLALDALERFHRDCYLELNGTSP